MKITRPNDRIIHISHEGRDIRVAQPPGVQFTDEEIREALGVSPGKHVTEQER